MGGFAIGTTEFVSMGLLPQLAAGVGRVHPDGRARDLGVRHRRGGRRPADRGVRRPAPAQGAADRPDAGLPDRQRGQRPGHRLHLAHPGPVLRRPAARRLLRGRLPRGGRPGHCRAAWPGGQPGDARSGRRQRRRRSGRHLARPARRLAFGVLAGDRARRPDRRAGALAGAARPGQPRGDRPQRAARVQEPAGPAHPARRGDRLRRHVRGVHLHRPDRHRRRRARRGAGAALPAGHGRGHGGRYAAGRAPRRLVDLPVPAGLLGRRWS